ncbi:hypothetical protein [Aurantivibrio infirmus]
MDGNILQCCWEEDYISGHGTDTRTGRTCGIGALVSGHAYFCEESYNKPLKNDAEKRAF